MVGPEVRIVRTIRDIPAREGDTKPSEKRYVVEGIQTTNLRQTLHKKMNEEGWNCQCIRCHEVKNHTLTWKKLTLVHRSYQEPWGATEHFLSYESYPHHHSRRTLYGFVRLRIGPEIGLGLVPELQKCALLRELHVYGKVQPTRRPKGLNSHHISQDSTQHQGLGGKLVHAAEVIALKHGLSGVAIISGVGVREYYRRKGYQLRHTYMIKTFSPYQKLWYSGQVRLLFLLVVFVGMIYLGHWVLNQI